MIEPENPVPNIPKTPASPPGLLPRNTQAWLIGGVSLLMVLVIALTGRNNPKEHSAVSLQTAGADATTRRIEDYRMRIDQEAQKLQLERARLAQTQSVLGQGPGTSGQPMPAGPVPTYSSRYAMPNSASEDSLETERQKREYLSLFASNVALTFRATPTPSASAATTTSPDTIARTVAAYLARTSQPALPEPEPKAPQPAGKESIPTKTDRTKERDSEIDRADGPRHRLFEGTVLETVLTNRLDGSFSGPVNCMVTTNVYSHNGQHLLIPQGSRVFGEVRKIETFGEGRLAVTFHRLLMPDGYSVNLDQFRGLNQIGETGLKDQVNHHYMQTFGVSLAIGAIAGLSQANTSYGTNESAADAYRQGAATSLSQSSLRILDRYLNVLPTVTIREGHRVKIYLSDDLLLPAYDKHRMEDNL